MISGLFLSNNEKNYILIYVRLIFHQFIIVYFSFNKYLIIEDPIRPSEPVTKHFFLIFKC